ncbi:MAG: succinylglutamate desuccinylase/aspartoacylase family protein [Firmicutes bacterium]|nr:succinylglutamate desuccinylase/aspartoacylase family protein [Bacillota bacterium]
MMKKKLVVALTLMATIVVSAVAAGLILAPTNIGPLHAQAYTKQTFQVTKYDMTSAHEITYHIFDTGVTGARVAIIAGIHGNEPAGIYAAQEIVDNFNFFQGQFLIMPIAHPRAYDLGLRFPPGYSDLNRAFPGDPNGTLTQQIASVITEVMQDFNPDIIIDLHEASLSYLSGSVGHALLARPYFLSAQIAATKAINESGLTPELPFVALSAGAFGAGTLGQTITCLSDHLGVPVILTETTTVEFALPIERRIQQQVFLVQALAQYYNRITSDLLDIWMLDERPLPGGQFYIREHAIRVTPEFAGITVTTLNKTPTGITIQWGTTRSDISLLLAWDSGNTVNMGNPSMGVGFYNTIRANLNNNPRQSLTSTFSFNTTQFRCFRLVVARNHTVNFDSRGGSVVDPTRISHFHSRLTSPQAPTREGFEFQHWADSNGVKFDFANQSITSNITLQAVWSEVLPPAWWGMNPPTWWNTITNQPGWHGQTPPEWWYAEPDHTNIILFAILGGLALSIIMSTVIILLYRSRR